MSDEELLELAAKAAGMPRLALYDTIGDHGSVETPEWNPIADDGEALRLAVKLGMLLDTRYTDPETQRYNQVHYWPVRTESSKRIDFGDRELDPNAATRRAIVRAAAEMGQSK